MECPPRLVSNIFICRCFEVFSGGSLGKIDRFIYVTLFVVSGMDSEICLKRLQVVKRSVSHLYAFSV